MCSTLNGWQRPSYEERLFHDVEDFFEEAKRIVEQTGDIPFSEDDPRRLQLGFVFKRAGIWVMLALVGMKKLEADDPRRDAVSSAEGRDNLARVLQMYKDKLRK